MTGQASLKAQERGPSGGSVRISGLRWFRLHYGGGYGRWHAIAEGLWSICGRQNADYPEVQYADTQPKNGKHCKFCVTRLAP